MSSVVLPPVSHQQADVPGACARKPAAARCESQASTALTDTLLTSISSGRDTGQATNSPGLRGTFYPDPQRQLHAGPLASGQRAPVASDVGRKLFGFGYEPVDNNSAYYEGQFKVRARWGHGTLCNEHAGASYIGQFQNEFPHGQGKQLWQDGSTYIGEWDHGQKQGHGQFTCSRSLRYDGQWDRGTRHGRGTQELPNGDVYEGDFTHGMYNGRGIYRFADGSRYEGVWLNGRYDGVGVFYGEDGLKERRWYTNGILITSEHLKQKGLKKGIGQDLIDRDVTWTERRHDKHKPALLPPLQPSTYLIRRETAGIDLSAPPLTERAPRAAPRQQEHGGDACDGSSTHRPARAYRRQQASSVFR